MDYAVDLKYFIPYLILNKTEQLCFMQNVLAELVLGFYSEAFNLNRPISFSTYKRNKKKKKGRTHNIIVGKPRNKDSVWVLAHKTTARLSFCIQQGQCNC